MADKQKKKKKTDLYTVKVAHFKILLKPSGSTIAGPSSRLNRCVGTRVAHGVRPSLDPAGEDTLSHQPVVPVTVHVPVGCG